MKRAIAVTVATAALAGLAALAARSPSPASAPPTAEPVTNLRPLTASSGPAAVARGAVSPSASSTTTPRADGCALRPGQRLAYEVRASSTSRLSAALLGAADATPVEFSASLKARLDWEVLPSGDGKVILVGQFSDVAPAGTAFGTTDLAPSFLVELTEGCTVAAFARAKDVAPATARNEQALVFETRWAWTDAAGRAFTGRNATGEYEGTLRRRPDGTIERALKRYTTVWASGSAAVGTQASLVIEPGAGPWFQTASSTERYDIDGRTVTTEVGWVRVPEREFSPSHGRDVSGYVWEDLLPVRADARAPRQVTQYDLERRGRVANQTLEQALTGLADREGKVGIQDTWPDLAAWFEVHPEQIGPAVLQLQAGAIPPQAIADFYLALGKARTPVARDTLLTLRRSPTEPPMDRVRATMALVDRDDVGLDLAHELASEGVGPATLSKADVFLSGESLLALTIMSGRRQDPQLVGVARETLTGVLGKKGPTTRAALAAVGNSGDPLLLPVAAAATTSDDYRTRKAAAAIFRRMPVAQSERMALEWLAREKHPFVKARLWEVLRLQHFDAQAPASEALTRQAMKDLPQTRSPIARKQLVRFIATSVLKDDPAFRTFLKAQAREEHLKNTGVLNEFTEVLTPDEVWEVLK